jgi:hypothetical protein
LNIVPHKLLGIFFEDPINLVEEVVKVSLELFPSISLGRDGLFSMMFLTIPLFGAVLLLTLCHGGSSPFSRLIELRVPVLTVLDLEVPQ